MFGLLADYLAVFQFRYDFPLHETASLMKL